MDLLAQGHTTLRKPHDDPQGWPRCYPRVDVVVGLRVRCYRFGLMPDERGLPALSGSWRHHSALVMVASYLFRPLLWSSFWIRPNEAGGRGYLPSCDLMEPCSDHALCLCLCDRDPGSGKPAQHDETSRS